MYMDSSTYNQGETNIAPDCYKHIKTVTDQVKLTLIMNLNFNGPRIRMLVSELEKVEDSS